MIECFGDNQFGQSSPPSGTFAKVSAGRDSTCALRADGTISCWGHEKTGIVTNAPTTFGFDHISVGGEHACALKKQRVTCWGKNDYGQLDPPEPKMDFTSVACGTSHTCAVQSNGARMKPLLEDVLTPLNNPRINLSAPSQDRKSVV